MNKNLAYGLVFAAGLGISSLVNNYQMDKKLDKISADITQHMTDKYDALSDFTYESFDSINTGNVEKFVGYFEGNHLELVTLDGKQQISVRTLNGEYYHYSKNIKDETESLYISTPTRTLSLSLAMLEEPTLVISSEKGRERNCALNDKERAVYKNVMPRVNSCLEYALFKTDKLSKSANQIENKYR